jgi:hypothetical protein
VRMVPTLDPCLDFTSPEACYHYTNAAVTVV